MFQAAGCPCLSHSVRWPFQCSTANLCYTLLTAGYLGFNNSEGDAKPVPRHVNEGAKDLSKPFQQARKKIRSLLPFYAEDVLS